MSEVKILMVSEKPLIASTIARILSSDKYTTRSGKSNVCKVHEYRGEFQNKKALFRVTSVIGHIFSTDFPQEFQNRETVDPITLFRAPTVKKESKPEARIVAHLKSEAKGCDYLILWLDCDREGENICFEVINSTEKTINKSAQILRAHFSSLAPVDIRAAMKNLGVPNLNESQSVDARQEIDLKVGVAFSRFQTKHFQGKFGNLDSHLISYGPCQTPTLGFCVDRHDEIQTFTPEPFWTVNPTIQAASLLLPLDWARKRVFDHSVGLIFEQIVKQVPDATLISCVSKEGSTKRPKPLNTVELLKIASKQLGIGPHTTMQVAEHLYTSGYISYPRTETTKYPSNFDIQHVLRDHQRNSVWGSYCQALLQTTIKVPTGGTDAGDHPPITPMREAGEGELTGNHWRVYEYITRHFLATVSKSCKFKKTKAVFHIGPETFSCSGKQMIEEGFIAILPWCKVADTQIPDFGSTKTFPVTKVQLKAGETSPPGYLTESELIGMMEKHGIGTDASISTHINNICERSYVRVEGIGRTLVPTPIGIALVHGYHRIDPDLVLPVIRSSIENYVNYVAQGKATVDQVVTHSLTVFEQKYEYFVNNIGKMQELFEADFSPIEDTVGKFSSKCGKCNRFMKFLKPARMFCQTCDQVYPLPQNANIKLYKELKCPLDDFELVLVCIGKTKSYPVCPYCFNYPPFENVPTGMGCNQCIHPTCRHSLVSNAFVSCPDCEKGTLYFDSNSKPNWRMNCNACQFVMFVAKGAHDVKLLKDVCECGAKLVHIEFDKKEIPEWEGVKYNDKEGCLLCDDFLNSLMHSELSKRAHPMFRRGGRGGKRGRGGKGRGKGRR